MGTSRRTSLSLLIGLGAAGCMPHAGNAPSSSTPTTPVLSKHSAGQPDVPLVEGAGDQAQQIVADTVNDRVSRVSQIIRERDQAKILASDIKEQREAAAEVRAAKNGESASTGQGDADLPEGSEKLAAKLRAGEKNPTVDNHVDAPKGDPEDAWANTGLSSAAQPPENGDFGDALPARKLQGVQGSVAAPTDVQRVQPNGPTPGINRQPNNPSVSGIDPLLALQEQFLNRVNDQPKNLAAQLELQLARLLRNEPVPAMADLSTLSGEDRELLAAVSDALANFRNLVRNDPNPLGSEKARPFIDMADRIRARSDLSVQSVNLCTSVKAFGNYDPIEPMTFLAGNPTWSVFYCEVDGFLSQLNEKQRWESKLSLELRLFNEAGMQLWQVAPETVSDSSRKRRRDFFIAKKIQLPSKLAPGPYMLKATIRDLQANRVAESTLQVSIVGK